MDKFGEHQKGEYGFCDVDCYTSQNAKTDEEISFADNHDPVVFEEVVMQGKQFFKFSSPCMFKKLTTAFLSKEAENYKVPPASGITGNNLGMRERQEKY